MGGSTIFISLDMVGLKILMPIALPKCNQLQSKIYALFENNGLYLSFPSSPCHLSRKLGEGSPSFLFLDLLSISLNICA